MKAKRISRILTAALALLCLTGCAGKGPEEETLPREPEHISLSLETEREGKRLTIDAEVELPDLTRLEEITLGFDEEAFQAAGRDLVLRQYPYLKEGLSPDGYRGWSEETPERLLISFDGQDTGFRAGWCSYLDVLRDLNGQEMGDGAYGPWHPDFLTENVPNKLTVNAAEAAEQIAAELEKYSCFTYEPWNVTAYNVREKPDSSGYYSARMRPYLEGWPVRGRGPLEVSAHMSAEGLFAFQGVILLKETGREAVPCGMDVQEAVAQFQEDFAELAVRDHILVDSIRPGYVARSTYNGSWTLSPAWIFTYRDIADAEPNDRDFWEYTCAYRMENGKLTRWD